MNFNKKDIRKWSILGSRGTLGVTLLDLARIGTKDIFQKQRAALKIK